MKKNKKNNIINLLILAVTIILIGGALLIANNIISIQSESKTEIQKEETIEEEVTENNIPTAITTAEEMIELLDNTYKKEGYSFVHKQTEGNQIVVNQVNTESGEVLNEYIYNIDTNSMSVKSYNTSTNSVTSE